MKTSEIIRESINTLWDEHEYLVTNSLLSLAETTRKSIRKMEREYKRAVRREKREAGNK